MKAINIIFREGKDVREDPKLGTLFSLSGTLKIVAMCRKGLDNKLWFNFCEGIENDKEGKVLFSPQIEFTETLIKLKHNPTFTTFHYIIDTINDKPQLLFDTFDNIKALLELCEAYGREYGLAYMIPQECRQQKDLIFIVNFIYNLFCKIKNLNK